jgi:hypothetical protein
MKPCMTCLYKPVKNGIYEAHLEHFAEKQLPKDNKCFHKKDENIQKIKLSNLTPNKTIFYFGANERDFTKSIQSRLKAYGKLENSGVVRANKEGEAIVYLYCPQLYINYDDKVYSRHLHFLYWNDNLNKWNKNLYTQQVLCNISKELLEKQMKKICLVDVRLEGSMPYNKRWTVEKVFEALGIKDGNKLVPIVLYGKKDIDIVQQMHDKLNKLGFLNTQTTTFSAPFLS